MKRMLAVAFVLMLVASACSQQTETQTDDGEAPPAEEPQESALASWVALDGIADRLGLSADQKAEVATGIEDDPAGDQYHPGGQLTPMENTDIVRVAAFSLELDQAKADELFNATEFPCSSPEDLAGLGEGGLVTWCPDPDLAMPPGPTNFYCGEVGGMFPTTASDPNINYEYGVAFHLPDGENFQPQVQGDLFTDAGFAVGARYNAQGPNVFRLRYQGQGGGFVEEQQPYKVLLTYAEGSSTFCGVIPQTAIGEDASYPFRMFSFCGNFQQGAADILPDDIQQFHNPVTIKLKLTF